MSVATRSADYKAREVEWALMRAFCAGRDAVLNETYLRKLPGHDKATYDLFKYRAYFFGATQRSVDGLTGLMFRKPPATEWPAAFEPIAENITGAGESAASLAEAVADELMTVGRVGVLVDYPGVEDGATITRADQASMGLRPYAKLYATESILGWRTITLGSETVLSQVRLAETREDWSDEFEAAEIPRVRVLDLDGAGAYRVRVYEQNSGGEWEIVEGPYNPTMNGAVMARIPFRFFAPRGSRPEAQRPPLLDLAQANMGHLNDAALHQWGLMWTANPTACFKDLRLGEGESVVLGAASGLNLGENGDAFFLEFTGAGLQALERAMESKRRDMAVLGARMLQEDRRQVEAAETAAIHRSGENSVLAAVAASISEGMGQVLEWCAAWAGVTGETFLDVNTDFMPAQMDGQTLTALMAAWQGGGITRRDLFQALRRGEIIDGLKTYDQHAEELDDEMPPVPAMTADGDT